MMRRLLAVKLLTVLGCGLCLGCGVHVILTFLHGRLHSSLPADSLLLYPAISVVTFISVFTFWQLLPCSRRTVQREREVLTQMLEGHAKYFASLEIIYSLISTPLLLYEIILNCSNYNVVYSEDDFSWNRHCFIRNLLALSGSVTLLLCSCILMHGLRRRSRRCVRIYLWTVQGVSYLLLLVVVFQTFGWGREFQTGSTIYSGVISRHRYLLFFIIPVTLLSIYVNGLIFLYYSLVHDISVEDPIRVQVQRQESHSDWLRSPRGGGVSISTIPEAYQEAYNDGHGPQVAATEPPPDYHKECLDDNDGLPTYDEIFNHPKV